jgi:hypothetical protein
MIQPERRKHRHATKAELQLWSQRQAEKDQSWQEEEKGRQAQQRLESVHLEQRSDSRLSDA